LLDFSSLGESKKSCVTYSYKGFLWEKKMHHNHQISKKYFLKKTLHILTLGSSKWRKIEQDYLTNSFNFAIWLNVARKKELKKLERTPLYTFYPALLKLINFLPRNTETTL
jgi:hypothetical protein